MARFNLNKLPELTKSMYESQLKWNDKNWKDSIKNHHKEIEKLLEKVEVFDSWQHILESKYKNITKELIPEILMDSYLSVHFACMGLYKLANISLRTQLETSLRLVFFSTHPVEFNWWYSGKDEYFKKKAVWGEQYTYFTRLDEVKDFQAKCKESGNKVDLFDDIRILYGKLSQYVHSGVHSYLTTPERVSPKYRKDELGKWIKNFKETQKYINTVLTLGFADEFKSAKLDKKKKILKAIENDKFKTNLRKSLGLKFRGRI